MENYTTNSKNKRNYYFISVRYIFLIFILFFNYAGKTQTAPQFIADSLQAILNKSLPIGVLNPGVVMSVYVPGQWTWSGSSGKAISGMTVGYPATNVTSDHKFRAGSLTKTFMATAIMLLEEQGLLNIEDTIGKYLRPSLVNDTIMSSEPVKIRHLLNHTSGIDNSANNIACQQNALANLNASHTIEEAIYCGASQGEVFPPEFAWAYSNTNYSILAMIIENVSGQTSKEFIKQNIIIPLGLTDTEIPITNEITTPHMGCYWNIGFWVDMTIVNASLYWGWADIVSTTADLNKFYSALLNSQIVNQTSLTKMKTMYPGTFDYGLGLDFYTIGNAGIPYFGHTGEVGNSSSMFYAQLSTSAFPEGYFISYNFNYQGVDMWTVIDEPIFNLMNGFAISQNEITETNQTINIYPNPVKEQLKITIPANKTKNINITICDISGRVVIKSDIDNSMQSDSFTISLSDLTEGIYLYEIQTENSNRKGKFVKAN